MSEPKPLASFVSPALTATPSTGAADTYLLTRIAELEAQLAGTLSVEPEKPVKAK